MKKVFFSLLTAGIVLTTTPKAMAMVMPPFSSCLNPQGTVQASYSDGVHGIVGDPGTYTGKDTVYSVDGNNFLQCFCPPTGSGIQTQWLKVSNLSDTDIKLLQAQGWIYVQDGSAWGLDPAAYLAKNDPFVCNGTVLSSTPPSSNNSSNSSSSSSSSSPASQSPAVSLNTGEVLGLANTGNMQLIVGLFSFGVMALISSVLLKRVNS